MINYPANIQQYEIFLISLWGYQYGYDAIIKNKTWYC